MCLLPKYGSVIQSTSITEEGGGRRGGGRGQSKSYIKSAKGPKVITIFRAVRLMNTCGCVLKL